GRQPSPARIRHALVTAPQADTERARFAKRNERLADEVAVGEIEHTRFHNLVREIVAENRDLPAIVVPCERDLSVQKHITSGLAGFRIGVSKIAVSAKKRLTVKGKVAKADR